MTKKNVKNGIKITKKQTRGDEIIFIFFSLIIFMFLFVSLIKFSIIGKFIDDFCFAFLFGWVKYLIYLLSFGFIIPLCFNYRLTISGKYLWCSLLIIILSCWTTHSLTLLITNTNTKKFWTSYQNLNLVMIVNNYFTKWWNIGAINNYNGIFGAPIIIKDFTVSTFFPSYATGGMISNIITGFFNYGFFISNLIINIITIFFFSCYLIFKKPFILFTKIKWLMSYSKKKCGEHKINRKQKQKQHLQKKEQLFLNKIALAAAKKAKLTQKAKINAVPLPLITEPPLNDDENVKNIVTSDSDSYLTPFGKVKSRQQKSTTSSKGVLVVKKSLENSVLNNTSSVMLPNDDEITTEKTKPLNNESITSYFPSPININSNYVLPQLIKSQKNDNKPQEDENRKLALANQEKLATLFKQFNIKGTVHSFHLGSAITKYEVSLTPGVKVNKITSLEDNIKLTLGSSNIRIEAPIPGKSMVGIETPNKHVIMVCLQEVMANIKASDENKKLLVAIGKDSIGNYIFQSLAEMPHLLVAGTTGSGKSVFINTFLISLLLRYKPHEIKLVLIDPKWVELVAYNEIPHLLTPVINKAVDAVASLKVVLMEMQRRYQMLAQNGVRNIVGYNNKVNSETEKIPYYIIIIDELADLMVKNSKEIEEGIMRITQMGRAAGIHLVVATQRPSTDIITGVIKNNIAARVSFKVSSWIDSRTVIDSSGAEKLIGKGDMLFIGVGSSSPIRIQAPWISEEEVATVIAFIKKQSSAQYDETFMLTMTKIK